MVVERPGYGYDLRCRIEQRLPFLGYTEGAVYPALDRLEQDGLIVPKGAKVHGRAPRGSPRVIYTATEAGVEEFGRWMYEFSSPPAFRDELTAKLPLARPIDMARLIEITRAQEARLRSQWQQLTAPPGKEWTGAGKVPWPLVAERLVRSTEARRIAAAIESLEEIRDALQYEIDPPPGRSRLPNPDRRR